MIKKINVKVIPRSCKNEVIKQPDGQYKIRVTAAPTDGKANSAVIELLAKELDVPKSFLKIVAGETGKNKIVECQM